jgi:hypothetical protein
MKSPDPSTQTTAWSVLPGFIASLLLNFNLRYPTPLHIRCLVEAKHPTTLRQQNL